MACTYEDFLPQIVASIAEKKRTEQGFDENELRAVAAVAFKDSVKQFARDSRTLRKMIPMDIYEGVRYYPFPDADGYYIHEVEGVLSNRAEFPVGSTITREGITLSVCPVSDVSNAWMVEASVIPSGDVCSVDEAFCDRYQSPLLAGIMMRLAAQVSRPWFNLDLVTVMEIRYARALSETDRESIVRVEDSGAGDYTKFLPAVVTALVPLEGADHLRENVVRAAVQIAFRDTVIDFARQSRLYRVTESIDVYAGTCHFPVTPPAGFHLLEIENIGERRAKMPCNATIDDGMITLPAPALKDVSNAWEVETSVIPTHDTCVFDNMFLDRYYEAILAGIFSRLTIQGGKDWRALGTHDRWKADYGKLIASAKRKSVTGVVKSRKERLSDY